MSNFAHMILRRQQQERKPQVVYVHAGPGRRKAYTSLGKDGKYRAHTTYGRHRQGDQWWKHHASWSRVQHPPEQGLFPWPQTTVTNATVSNASSAESPSEATPSSTEDSSSP